MSVKVEKLMLPDSEVKKKVRTEVFKLSFLSMLIVSGGIILGVFVPITETVSWTDFIFYASIGSLIIFYLVVSFYFKTRKLNNNIDLNFEQDLEEVDVPITQIDTFGKQKYKGQVKLDEETASFCPRCGGSYSKTHRFCPNCGYCGIIKKLK